MNHRCEVARNRKPVVDEMLRGVTRARDRIPAGAPFQRFADKPRGDFMATRKTRKSKASNAAATPDEAAMGRAKARARPGPVWRTTVSRSIDALSQDQAALRTALRELRNAGPQSIVRAGIAAGLVEADEKRQEHIEEWIEQSADVLYRGLLEAGELALETGLPTYTLFVFGSERPRVAVTQTRYQITTLLLLPAPKERIRIGDGPTDNQAGITIIE
jgi:hypothetical protein